MDKCKRCKHDEILTRLWGRVCTSCYIEFLEFWADPASEDDINDFCGD